jgi:hypothetical protein
MGNGLADETTVSTAVYVSCPWTVDDADMREEGSS